MTGKGNFKRGTGEKNGADTSEPLPGWPSGPVKRAPEVIQLFQSLRKQAMSGKGGSGGNGRRSTAFEGGGAPTAIGSAPAAPSDPNAMFNEIHSKSPHAVKVQISLYHLRHNPK